MDPRTLLGVLWRRKLWAAAALALTLLASAVYVARQTPAYTVAAQVSVTPAKGTDYAAVSGLIDKLIPTLAAEVATAEYTDAVRKTLPAGVDDGLNPGLGAVQVTGSYVVRLTATASTPGRAAAWANASAAELPNHDISNGLLTVATIETATGGSFARTPQNTLTFVLAFLVGIALAVAAALVRESFDRADVTDAEVETELGAPVLARLVRPAGDAGLVSVSGPGMVVGGFRALRVALDAGGARDGHRLYVVAPAVSDGSGDWLAANVALSLAQVHQRVLFVQTSTSSAFPRLLGDGPAATTGLSDVLQGAPLADAVRPGPDPHLWVLGAGRGTGAMDSLLETGFGPFALEARASFDAVVVSAESLMVVDDGRVLAAHGRLLVGIPVEWTAPWQLDEISTSLRILGVTPIGCATIQLESAPVGV